MVIKSNFVVRQSGRYPGKYYIDYSGAYKINDISGITGLDTESLTAIYTGNRGEYDDRQKVYYFGDLQSAKRVVADVFSRVRDELRGRLIHLTEAEVEYIRKALIKEGSDPVGVNSSVKDEIFRKLNA